MAYLRDCGIRDLGALYPGARITIQSTGFHVTDKLHFTRRCGDSWRDLCDALGIEPYERARFSQGYEPAGIWEWLESRGRLADLPSALVHIGRKDLADDLKLETGVRDHGRHALGVTRKPLALTVGLPAVVFVIAAVLIVLSPWNPRSRGTSSSSPTAVSSNPTAASSSPSAPVPRPSTSVPSAATRSIRSKSPPAASGTAAIGGSWTGTLHCDTYACQDYPMEFTLRSGVSTGVVGESTYAAKNCGGTLTYTDQTDHGIMLTENIREPVGQCADHPMFVTARLAGSDRLEIKYWWGAQINPSSHSYAKATLSRAK
jgi:hypothetical protein